MMKCIRGGAWNYEARGLRSADRYGCTPTDRNFYIGLRVVCNTKKEGWISTMMKCIRYIRGAWYYYAKDSRSAYRNWVLSCSRDCSLGFRVVCNTKKEGWISAMIKYIRGGSWDDADWDCRSALRGRYTPTNRLYSFGLRVVCNTKKEGWISAMIKCIRGGSWGVRDRNSRSSIRFMDTPTYRGDDVGLRVVSNTKKEGWFATMMKYIRGGSWSSNARDCRSAYRFWFTPTNCINSLGLRVVCNTKKEGWISTMIKCIRGGAWNNIDRYCRSAYRSWFYHNWFYPTYRNYSLGLRATSNQSFGNLVYIPDGRFVMGSPSTEAGRYNDEEQHGVTIDQPFWMMDTPVTRSLYHEVMGLEFDGENPHHPMVYISWDESMEFCRRLSEQTGHQFTLPTESQWEYACRAGTTTAYYFGDDPKMLGDYGWYYGNCDSIQPVKQKKPNPWGLYDMHGLVWEWCLDGPEG